MSAYFLLRKVTAVQQPPGPANPPQCVVVPTWAVGANAPPSQTFSLTVDGVGAVAATAQVYVQDSEDENNNWATYGSPIVVASTLVVPGQSLPMATATGSNPFRRFCAIITSISGTSASAALRMAV